MKAIAVICLIAIVLATSGCGTIMSLHENQQQPYASNWTYVYSGVRLDLSYLFDSTPMLGAIWWKLCIVLDLPVSAAVDTICLPYTMYNSMKTPGKMIIDLRPQKGESTFVNLIYKKSAKNKYHISIQEACSIIKNTPGKPKSIEAFLFVEPEHPRDDIIPVTDFGAVYDAIEANPVLICVYRPNQYQADPLALYKKK